jgi:hypothetical protein
MIGCTGFKDVTFDPNFNIGYKKGHVYENLIDMYIIDDKNPYLVIPGEIYPSLERYLKNRNDYKDIKDILKKGNHLAIERLLYRSKFEGSYLDVFAQILYGDNAGEIVRLNLVSKIEYKTFPNGGAIPVPDPNLMNPINKEPYGD